MEGELQQSGPVAALIEPGQPIERQRSRDQGLLGGSLGCGLRGWLVGQGGWLAHGNQEEAGAVERPV